ncbi:MAG: hypothetical protein KJ709_07605 [Nanoarchaeota archaeon]|nr:hypothetical protein [Nanoarchaeota archaeon]
MANPPPGLSDFGKEITNTSSRLRMLEERITNIRMKLQVTEQNMVTMHRNTSEEMLAVKSDMARMKNDITDVKNTIQLMAAELGNFAKSEELRTLQKYLSYWEPVKFVTEEQVEKIVERMKEE